MCDRFESKPYTGGLLCKCGVAKKSHATPVPKPPIPHARSTSNTSSTMTSTSRSPTRPPGFLAPTRSSPSLVRSISPPPSTTAATTTTLASTGSPVRPAPSRLTSPSRSSHALGGERKSDARPQSKDKPSRSVSPPARQVDHEAKASSPVLDVASSPEKKTFLGRSGKPVPRPPSGTPSRFSSLLSFTSRSSSVCSATSASPPPPPSSSSSSPNSSFRSTLASPAPSSSFPPSKSLPAPLSRIPSSSSGTLSVTPSIEALTHSSSLPAPLSRAPSSSFEGSSLSSCSPVTAEVVSASPPPVLRPSSLPAPSLLRPLAPRFSPPPSPSLPPASSSSLLSSLVPQTRPGDNDVEKLELSGASASMTILSEITGSDSPVHDGGRISGAPRYAPPSRPRSIVPAPPPVANESLASTDIKSGSFFELVAVPNPPLLSATSCPVIGPSSAPSKPSHVDEAATGSPPVLAASTVEIAERHQPLTPPPSSVFVKPPFAHSRSSPDLLRDGPLLRRASGAPPSPPSRPPPPSPSRLPQDASATRERSPSGGGRIRELSPASPHTIELGPPPRFRDASPFCPENGQDAHLPQRPSRTSQRASYPDVLHHSSVLSQQLASTVSPGNTPMSHEVPFFGATPQNSMSVPNSPLLHPSPPFQSRIPVLRPARDFDLDSSEASKKPMATLGHSKSSPDLAQIDRKSSHIPPSRPPPPSPSHLLRRDPSPFLKETVTKKEETVIKKEGVSSLPSDAYASTIDCEKMCKPQLPPQLACWTPPECEKAFPLHHAILSMLAFRLPPPPLWQEH